MATIIRIDVSKDLSFLAEVDETVTPPPLIAAGSSGQLPPGATPTGAKEVLTKSVDMARDTIKAATLFVRDAFTEFNHPDEITIEFSMALKGKGGVPVLVEQSATATFKIAAKWVRSSHDNSTTRETSSSEENEDDENDEDDAED